MDNIIGIGLLCFSFFAGYNILNSSADTLTTKIYIQLVVSAAGGLFILYKSNKDKIGNFINTIKEKLTKKQSNSDRGNDQMDDKTNTENKDADADTDSDIVELFHTENEKEMITFNCLLFLRQRCIEIDAKECLELISKINTILFTLNSNKSAVQNGQSGKV